MIVIINGAPGTGKTKTAEVLLSQTFQSAAIDGDWLLGINPRNGTDDERRLRYKQIAGVIKVYIENGYKTIFVTFVYPGATSLSEQIELLSFDKVRVISLITEPEQLKKRHADDPREREEVESSIKLNDQIKQLSNCDFIDNTNLSPEETAEKISKLLSL